MSRLVEPRIAGKAVLVSGNRPAEPKEYLQRIGKYVPAEILAAYLAINGILNASLGQPWVEATDYVVFFLCLLCTPFYFRLFREGRPNTTRLHMIVSTIAFAVWVYGIGGFFERQQLWYYAGLNSILLVFFSLISGLVVPSEDTD